VLLIVVGSQPLPLAPHVVQSNIMRQLVPFVGVQPLYPLFLVKIALFIAVSASRHNEPRVAVVVAAMTTAVMLLVVVVIAVTAVIRVVIVVTAGKKDKQTKKVPVTTGTFLFAL